MIMVMHPLDCVAWYAGGTFRYLHHHGWCCCVEEKYTATINIKLILKKLHGGSVSQICRSY